MPNTHRNDIRKMTIIACADQSKTTHVGYLWRQRGRFRGSRLQETNFSTPAAGHAGRSAGSQQKHRKPADRQLASS
jgi:hypothetical protein